MDGAMADVNSGRLGIKKAAQKWGVPKSTLADRLKNRPTFTNQQQPAQRLSKAQEDGLVEWILRQEALGYPVTHSNPL
ncbi:hypothetical protein F5Y16DRAFT_377745 [Xylariaceae sp. FL0255]|nr:hypothetical protein F5Y16DRAFT_377745 [Xylariaceae sp. FL0255]